MRTLGNALLLVALPWTVSACAARAPAPSDTSLRGAGPTTAPRGTPLHYVFFSRDHDRIAETSFLQHEGIAGAQLTYTWRELEPERDRYELQPLRDRLAFLERHGKRLIVQLQDVSFSDRVLVPEYLRTDTTFHGGAARKYEGVDSAARFDGWVARRWDPAVRGRFIKLLEVLGKEFDGRMAGLVIPETAVGFHDPKLHPPGFTYEEYAAGIREMMSGARRAFPRSHVIIYANFMPGEWLPGNDKGYLRSVYAHAHSIGAGVGGPDILPHRRWQLRHSYPLIAARPPGVVAAVAVQDGNLAEKNPATGERVTVAELYRFAKDYLRLDYIFWGTEEPYYSTEIIPFLRDLQVR
jgi:hypothetical protein